MKKLSALTITTVAADVIRAASAPDAIVSVPTVYVPLIPINPENDRIVEELMASLPQGETTPLTRRVDGEDGR